jgi:hypothetical protein
MGTLRVGRNTGHGHAGVALSPRQRSFRTSWTAHRGDSSGAFAGDSDDFATITGTIPTSFVGYLTAHIDEAKEWAKGVKSWTRVS